MAGSKGKSSRMLLTIGAFKLVKAVLLLALAIGALKLLGKDLGDQLQQLAARLNVDPDNHYFQAALGKVAGLDEKKLKLLSAGTFFYAALFLVEGVGLLLQKRWGEILTVIITSTFLPLEIYELMKAFSVFKIILLFLNAAIVVYLIWRLRTEKGPQAK